MPTVTVLGAGHQTLSLVFDSAANASIAAQLAAKITQGVENGSIIPYDDTGGLPPPLPAGKTGEFIQARPGFSSLPKGYDDVIVTARYATVLGSGDANEAVLSTGGDLTFIATGGSGTVVAGAAENQGGGDGGSHRWLDRGPVGGNPWGAGGTAGGNQIIVPASDNGDWDINTGGGNDTVLALGGGNDTIATGTGHNLIELGSGNDSVLSAGTDTIVASSGHDTIIAGGQAQDFVQGGSGHIVFLGGTGPVTLFGGTGSDTFQGGAGSDLVYGGLGGNNSLVGGTGLATLFGGGTGDRLFAMGTQAQDLVAGIGNETLSAVSSSGAVSLVASSGHDTLLGGTGNDTFAGGTGASTMVGGSGKDIFEFVRSLDGGVDLVQNFTTADKIDLVGYGPHAVQDALNSQTFSNGSVTITLADNTRVTFAGVSELTAKNFTTGS